MTAFRLLCLAVAVPFALTLVGCGSADKTPVFFVPVSRHKPCVFVVATKMGKEIYAPRMVPCEYPTDIAPMGSCLSH